MRFSIRSLLLLVSVLAFALATLATRASLQRSAVLQLLEYDDVTVYFMVSGEYVDAMGSVDDHPNHFFYSATAVDVDLAFEDVTKLIPILRQLPALKEIDLNYQGNLPEKKYRELRQAFPGLKIEIHEYHLTIPMVG